MTMLRSITRGRRLAVLAVVALALVGGGIALALGRAPSHPAVSLKTTTPSPTATPTPAASTEGKPGVPAGSPQASPPPTVAAPTAPASTASPSTSPAASHSPAPAHLASPTPSPIQVVVPPTCTPKVKCLPPPCPDTDSCTIPTCPPNAMCAVPKAAAIFMIGDSANGTTVTVSVGDRLQVSLASTYWSFDPVSNPGVLGLQAPPQTVPCPTRTIPGSGCGTVTVTYAATASGTSVVAAHRESCGEALRCTGSEGTFTVTVVVR